MSPVLNPVGVDGPAGTNPRGAWSPVSTYGYRDMVVRRTSSSAQAGGTFMALTNGLNTDPLVDTANWLQLAADGAVGPAGGGGGADRGAQKMLARGLTGETFAIDGAYPGSVVTAVAQTVYATLCGFKNGDVISNIIINAKVASAGTPTDCRVGVFDLTGAQLAQSANVASSGYGVGFNTRALSAPYTVTSDRALYLAWWSTAYTTQPQFTSGNDSAAAYIFTTNLVATGRAWPSVKQASQTAFPSPATWAADLSNIWFGWS